MRTFAGIGLVLAGEVAAALVLAAARRLRGRRRGLNPLAVEVPGKAASHLATVLELEPEDPVLPGAGSPPIPAHVLAGLRADPRLGLADVRLVQHLQPAGAGLPERSPAGASYQGLNRDVARHADADPVPAARLTWLTMRLELPGSRQRAWAERAAGPILARGGGLEGARRTLDKAARTAAAQLAVAGYRTTVLTEADYQPGFRCDLADVRDATDTVTATASAEEAAPDLITTPGGVLVGVDPAHRPVVLGLFRRKGLSAAVIGGRHLAETLVLRCAAVGARVIVETARHHEWDAVLSHSGLDAAHLAVQPAGNPAGNASWPRPTAAAPLLVLRDCGARPPYAAVPRGPWTAVVTLLPYLEPRSANYLRDADLVGLQRMPLEEAAMVRRVLSLTDEDTKALPDLPDAMAIWRSKKRTVRYCELAATQWEAAFLGEPVR